MSTADATPAARRAPSRRRLWGFRAAALLLALAILEGVSQLAMFLLNGAEWRNQQERLASFSLSVEDSGQVLHPFIGATYDPQVATTMSAAGYPARVNELGFAYPTPAIQKRRPGRLLIGVTGGSVAWEFQYAGGPLLKTLLRESPRFRDVEIELIGMAFQGGKQPQQLASLEYVLALGGEFDVVVNLDGYNEAALATDVYRHGSHPIYPVSWNHQLHAIPDPARFADEFRYWEIRADRRRLAESVRDSWLRRSALVNIVWKLRDKSLAAEEAEAYSRALQERVRDRAGFQRAGPPVVFPDDDALYDALVAIWSASSRQMHHAAGGCGAVYVHCLQPNQYDPGAKPFSPEERANAYNSQSRYRPAIEACYPRLRAAGARLQTEGIRFHDLSRLFEGRSETLFSDDCCHLNQAANDLLARSIAAAILEALPDSPEP
jgi:hypothetical protein